MPWHAFTFDGLDNASAEFAEQADLTPGGPGVVTQVNQQLVGQMMNSVQPYLQKAVSAGLTDTIQAHKTQLTIGMVAAGSFAVAALAFLWRMSTRMKECCPARPVRSVGNCCG